jgi:DNA invertase Pin-like site-specific DNA recombinase
LRAPYFYPTSITENIDTTTSGGKLVFHIFGALAEFERDIIKDRTKAGLHAARVRGRLGGRPKAKTLDTPKKVALAQSLYENENNTIDEIVAGAKFGRATTTLRESQRVKTPMRVSWTSHS